MKNIDIARLALSKLSSVDEALCTVSFSETREFTCDAGDFSLLRTLFDKNISVSAIKDKKKASIAQNDVSEEGIKNLSDNLMLSIESSEADDAWEFSKEKKELSVEGGDYEPDLEKLFFRAKELLEEIKNSYRKIIVEQLVVKHKKADSVMLSSSGLEFNSKSGYYSVSLMFSGHEGDKSSSFNGAGALVKSLDKPFIELGSIRESVASAEKQIDTMTVDGKFDGVVVFTPDCAEGIVDSLLENYVGAGVILEGKSQWKDKLNQKVVAEDINIAFNCRSDEIVAKEYFTGEGFEADSYNLIENGVLKSFMINQYVANKVKGVRAKNSGVGMMIKSGTRSIEDIISGIKKGVLVGRFSGGEPGVSGEFSGVAKNSFIIENGKVGKALSETMISGNLEKMFNSLVAISKESVNGGTSVVPYLAFDGITISGK